MGRLAAYLVTDVVPDSPVLRGVNQSACCPGGAQADKLIGHAALEHRAAAAAACLFYSVTYPCTLGPSTLNCGDIQQDIITTPRS
jgi:hypothetical protein